MTKPTITASINVPAIAGLLRLNMRQASPSGLTAFTAGCALAVGGMAVVSVMRSGLGSSCSDAGIGEAIGKIGQEVRDDDHRGREEEHAEHGRIIAPEDRIEGEPPHSGPIENRLHEQC